MKKIIGLLLVCMGLMIFALFAMVYQMATTGEVNEWNIILFLSLMGVSGGLSLVIFGKMFFEFLDEKDEPKIKISFDDVYRFKNPVSKFHRDKK